jgi:CYTH domain-containing protein
MFEIERKFLILRPDDDTLSQYEHSQIKQTYLIPNGRVRARRAGGNTVYTHTVKTSVTDVTRIEVEREVTESEYKLLLEKADPDRKPVCKTRYLIPAKGLVFELDDYGSEYTHALLEIELESEDSPFNIPNFITVIREVSSEKEYRNSSIAKDGFLDK